MARSPASIASRVVAAGELHFRQRLMRARAAGLELDGAARRLQRALQSGRSSTGAGHAAEFLQHQGGERRMSEREGRRRRHGALQAVARAPVLLRVMGAPVVIGLGQAAILGFAACSLPRS